MIDKQKRNIVENNYEEKQQFVFNAINDISGNIKFLDTKAALLLTTIGVISTGLLTVNSALYKYLMGIKTYNSRLALIVILGLYLISTLMAAWYLILTILPIKVKPQTGGIDSLWYKSKDESFSDYFSKIKKSNNNTLLEHSSFELYKLNVINSRKMKNLKTGIISFMCSLFFIGLIAITAIYFLGGKIC